MRKVLIIDDEPNIAAFMAALVELELGFAPVVACNEETALEAISSFDYDLIISDTLSFRPHLPEERGGDRWRWLDQLHKQLHARRMTIPVLLMTAYPVEVYHDYTAHGLSGFIPKPFDLQETLQVILRAIANSSEFEDKDQKFRLTSLIARKAAATIRLDQNFMAQMTA